jgi:hypothetical protein
MKVKELIKQLLKEANGDENLEVCIGNIDISFVHKEPAYYDGSLQVIVRNEKGRPIGGKYKREGSKIQIDTLDFYTLLWDKPEAEIDYSELDEARQISCKGHHDKLRKEVLDFEYKLEVEYFTEFIKEQIINVVDIPDNLDVVSKRFYDESGFTHNDKIPDSIPIIMESYISRRKKHWAMLVEVTYDGVSGLKIYKRVGDC